MTWLGELPHRAKDALPFSFTCIQKKYICWHGLYSQNKMHVLCNCVDHGGQLRVVHCSPGGNQFSRKKAIKDWETANCIIFFKGLLSHIIMEHSLMGTFDPIYMNTFLSLTISIVFV